MPIDTPSLLSNLLLAQATFVTWRRQLALIRGTSNQTYPLSPISVLADNMTAIIDRFEANFTSPSNFPRETVLKNVAMRANETLSYLISWANTQPGSSYLTELTNMSTFFTEAEAYFNPEI